jgi:hypothetical protein
MLFLLCYVYLQCAPFPLCFSLLLQATLAQVPFKGCNAACERGRYFPLSGLIAKQGRGGRITKACAQSGGSCSASTSAWRTSLLLVQVLLLHTLAPYKVPTVTKEKVMVDAGRWRRTLMRMSWEHVPTCAVGVVCKVAVVVVVVALL